MIISPSVTKLVEFAADFFRGMTFEEGYNTYISIAALIWLIVFMIRDSKRNSARRKKEGPTATYRKISKREMKKRLTQRNFRADGSYFDRKRNVWVNEADFKEINTIPEDYYWDDKECRWLPPNHPDHPRFHMNDRDLFNED